MLNFFRNNSKRHQEFLDLWQPVLDQAKRQMPEQLPCLSKKDVRYFIDAWNAAYEAANDDEKVGLAVLAYRVDIHRYAAGMLIDRKTERRLGGIKILGYMSDESAWPVLLTLANSDDPDVSLTALRSLVQINIGRTIAELFDAIISRKDWPTEQLVSIFRNENVADLIRIIEEKVNQHEIDNSDRTEAFNQLK
jgi:hypothetical protein